MNKKIAIIGMGHMGKAFYEGLIFTGINKEDILVSDNSQDNKKIVADADWIVLAVKPMVISQVIAEIRDVMTDKLILSLACGVTIATIAKQIGNTEQKIIRLMPNLPVAYGKGVIGYYKNNAVFGEEKDAIESMLSGLGSVIFCKKEEDLDAMTILSGSGPAVVAYCLSLFEKAGESFGFEKTEAQKIAYQTFVGTLELLKQTGQTVQELQDAVATKGGTTEAIIKSLDEEKMNEGLQKSLDIGYARIKKISSNLSS